MMPVSGLLLAVGLSSNFTWYRQRQLCKWACIKHMYLSRTCGLQDYLCSWHMQGCCMQTALPCIAAETAFQKLLAICYDEPGNIGLLLRYNSQDTTMQCYVRHLRLTAVCG